MRSAVPPLLAVVLCACGLEFTDPQRYVPATLVAEFTYEDRDASLLTLSATFTPGTDRDGVPLHLVDDTLRLLDTLLAPDVVEASGRRIYSGTWTSFHAMEHGWIVLQPPRIDSQGDRHGMRSTQAWVIRRAGDRSLSASRGDSLVLVIDPGPETRAPPVSARWELEIRGEHPPAPLRITTDGTPPSRITVPPEWIEGLEGNLAARLLVRESWEVESGSGDYHALTTVASDIEWLIRRDP